MGEALPRPTGSPQPRPLRLPACAWLCAVRALPAAPSCLPAPACPVGSRLCIQSSPKLPRLPQSISMHPRGSWACRLAAPSSDGPSTPDTEAAHRLELLQHTGGLWPLRLPPAPHRPCGTRGSSQNNSLQRKSQVLPTAQAARCSGLLPVPASPAALFQTSPSVPASPSAPASSFWSSLLPHPTPSHPRVAGW